MKLLHSFPQSEPLEPEAAPTWKWDRPATLLFTSGSGGNPRLVVHSAGNHWSSAVAANQHAPMGPGDRWLCHLPLYHVGGLAIVFRCLAAGATVCLAKPRESVATAVQRTRATHLSLVPTQLHRWLEDPAFDATCVKRVLMGGAPLSDGLRDEATARDLPLAVSYGMTETGSQVAATLPGEFPVGAGRSLPHARIRMTSDGEILVRGPSVALGEWTGETLRPLVDSEGWLHTRDRGRLEQGILHVEGRMDDQFISGGENIQPEIIERALGQLPDIGEAVVVPMEDIEFGHRPAAWVDVTVTPALTAAWNRALRKLLPGYMIPVRYLKLPPAFGFKRDREELRRKLKP